MIFKWQNPGQMRILTFICKSPGTQCLSEAVPTSGERVEHLSRSVIYGRFGSSYEFPILFVLVFDDLNFRHTFVSSKHSFSALPSALISRIEGARNFSGRADVVASLYRPQWSRKHIVMRIERAYAIHMHIYL